MRDLLFPTSPVHRGALAEPARLQALGFVMECRAIVGIYETADRGDDGFVHGDVAGTLHLAPCAAQAKATTAVAVMSHPRLVAALEQGLLGGGQAMALLAAAKEAAITVDAEAARRRHEQGQEERRCAGRPGVGGMGQVVVDCTATGAATIQASLRQRAAAMSFDDPELTEGHKQVAARGPSSPPRRRSDPGRRSRRCRADTRPAATDPMSAAPCRPVGTAGSRPGSHAPLVRSRHADQARERRHRRP